MSAKKNKTVKELSLELEQVKLDIIFLRQYIDSISIKADVTLKKSDVDKTNTKDKTVELFKCFKCDKMFQNIAILKNHIKENHKRLRKCTKCDSTFVKMNELESHIENIHPEEKKIKCNHCMNECSAEWR